MYILFHVGKNVYIYIKFTLCKKKKKSNVFISFLINPGLFILIFGFSNM